tara:strand:- start:4549 stop:5034 length:486 start_codon:yes stop_codon:yes gene_type:complete
MTNKTQEIIINLEPRGAARPRFASRGGFARAYTPKTDREWTAAAVHILRAKTTGQYRGPVAVDIISLKHRPNHLGAKDRGIQWANVKPDIDNVCKLTLDAATKAGVWIDDNQVCQLNALTLYHAYGDKPCVVLRVRSLVEVPPLARLGAWAKRLLGLTPKS